MVINHFFKGTHFSSNMKTAPRTIWFSYFCTDGILHNLKAFKAKYLFDIKCIMHTFFEFEKNISISKCRVFQIIIQPLYVFYDRVFFFINQFSCLSSHWKARRIRKYTYFKNLLLSKFFFVILLATQGLICTWILNNQVGKLKFDELDF